MAFPCELNVCINRLYSNHVQMEMSNGRPFPIGSDLDHEDVLTELALLLTNFYHLHGTKMKFGLKEMTLVVAPNDVYEIIGLNTHGSDLLFKYRPERKIKLCTHCIGQLWSLISSFKEENPDLFAHLDIKQFDETIYS
jgi:hypothetical protein